MTDCATQETTLMRASDQDRELAVSDLVDACQLGRISTDEYAVRAQAALSATTLGELWGLTWDVPRTPAAFPLPPVPVTSADPWSQPFPTRGWTYIPPRQYPRTRVNPTSVIAFAVSLVGLVTANFFIGGLIAGLLGLVALREADGREQDVAGHNFTTAALAISLSSLIIGIVILIHSSP